VWYLDTSLSSMRSHADIESMDYAIVIQLVMGDQVNGYMMPIDGNVRLLTN